MKRKRMAMINPDIVNQWMQAYRGRNIHLGFSGGADSTALLLLLHRAATACHLKLQAVHFDHRLRPDSTADATWCEQFCRKQRLPCRVVTLSVLPSPGETLEAAARRCRLAAWKQVTEPDAVIALGHHAGDRTENLLLRLCRGSNVSALTSMRTEQVIDHRTFIRPLLAYTRAEIIAFLQAAGVSDWREDASNRDTAFQRNFFRREILPAIYRKLPAAATGLIRSLEVLEQDADFIETAAAAILTAMDTTAGLDLKQFNRLHPALRIRILRYWMQREGDGVDFIPERHVLDRLADAVHAPAGDTVTVPCRGGRELTVHHGKITLHRPLTPPPPPQTRSWRQHPTRS
ncbi:MAG: tRNA lysidine(34) synthetase TilS, partial [Victivallales bacterium]|nr:tRNA lysidine(34) synthetase TilS [Victivallales bacterium]